MKKKLLGLFILVSFLSLAINAQTINVSNITTTGRFNTCGVGAPIITATYLYGTGSTVINGSLVCIDPSGTLFSVINITVSNLRWNKTPNVSWMHGLFLNNTTESGVDLLNYTVSPAGWIYTTGCFGACNPGSSSAGGRVFILQV